MAVRPITSQLYPFGDLTHLLSLSQIHGKNYPTKFVVSSTSAFGDALSNHHRKEADRHFSLPPFDTFLAATPFSNAVPLLTQIEGRCNSGPYRFCPFMFRSRIEHILPVVIVPCYSEEQIYRDALSNINVCIMPALSEGNFSLSVSTISRLSSLSLLPLISLLLLRTCTKQ